MPDSASRHRRPADGARHARVGGPDGRLSAPRARRARAVGRAHRGDDPQLGGHRRALAADRHHPAARCGAAGGARRGRPRRACRRRHAQLAAVHRRRRAPDRRRGHSPHRRHSAGAAVFHAERAESTWTRRRRRCRRAWSSRACDRSTIIRCSSRRSPRRCAPQQPAAGEDVIFTAHSLPAARRGRRRSVSGRGRGHREGGRAIDAASRAITWRTRARGGHPSRGSDPTSRT